MGTFYSLVDRITENIVIDLAYSILWLSALTLLFLVICFPPSDSFNNVLDSRAPVPFVSTLFCTL
jgi:hypothetical protein